ncbi:MAG: hypothetical protein MJK15_12375 [Colwellia sp.]|nr:hypothetical protein [Colwellia sp.]
MKKVITMNNPFTLAATISPVKITSFIKNDSAVLFISATDEDGSDANIDLYLAQIKLTRIPHKIIPTTMLNMPLV